MSTGESMVRRKKLEADGMAEARVHKPVLRIVQLGVCFVTLYVGLNATAQAAKAAPGQSIALVEDFDWTAEQTRSNVIKVVSQMGFVLHSEREDGGFLFIHHAPNHKTLEAVLPDSDRHKLKDVIEADLILSARVAGLENGKMRVGAKTLMLGYQSGSGIVGSRRVYHKLAESPVFPIFELMNHLRQGEKLIRLGVGNDHEMVTLLSFEEVVQRFRAFSESKSEPVAYFAPEYATMILREERPNIEALADLYDKKNLDKRFAYLRPAISVTIYWFPQPEGGGTRIRFLTAIVVERQTSQQQERKDDSGFQSVVKGNDQLVKYTEKLINRILMTHDGQSDETAQPEVAKGVRTLSAGENAIGVTSIFASLAKEKSFDKAYQLLSPAAKRKYTKEEFEKILKEAEIFRYDLTSAGVAKMLKEPRRIGEFTFIPVSYRVPTQTAGTQILEFDVVGRGSAYRIDDFRIMRSNEEKRYEQT